MTLQPSAGPIHTVTDPLTDKPYDDRSSPGSSIAVVRLTTQAVAPLEVGGPQGWLDTEFDIENCEDFLVGILAVVLLRDTTNTEVGSSRVLLNTIVCRLEGNNPGFE